MRTPTIILAVLLAVSFLNLSPARAQTDTDAREAIEELLAREVVAREDLNITARYELLDPDYLLIEIDGEPIERERYARPDRWRNVIAFDEVSIELDSLAVDGERAIGYTTEKASWRIRGREGSERQIERNARSRRLWVRDGGEWLERRTEILEEETLVDGEPVRAEDPEGREFTRLVWGEGVTAARERFDRARRQSPDTTLFAESTLNRLGYALLQRGRVEDAIEIFEMNVEAYPDAWNTYDSLGEGYLAAGDLERAKRSYRRSLELNPENDNARRMLQQIEEHAPAPLGALVAEDLGDFLHPDAVPTDVPPDRVAMPRMRWHLAAGLFRTDTPFDEVIAYYRDLEPRIPDGASPALRRVLEEQAAAWRVGRSREMPPYLRDQAASSARGFRVAVNALADGETDLVFEITSSVEENGGETWIVVFRQRRPPLLPPLPTIDGPETNDLASHVRGRLAWNSKGTVYEIAIPELDTLRVFRPTGEANVHDVAGPDREGRIVLIENLMMEGRHSVTVLEPGRSSSREVASRPGDALWQKAAGDPALAPVGGRVAMISTSRDAPVADRVVFRAGDIEILDVDDGRSTRTSASAVRDVTVPGLGGTGRELRELAWLPDGRRLVFSELVESDRLEGRFEAQRGRTDFARWDLVPVVTVLDVETGERRRLTVGLGPVASSTGRKVLTEDGHGHYALVDIETGQREDVEIPGDWRGPISLVEDRWLLYLGLPTAGAEPRYTIDNSPMVGPKPMGDLKVLDLESGDFQTLIRGIDPRESLEFGLATPP